MALPANRINLATNPAAANAIGYLATPGTGGAAAITNQTTPGHTGNDWNRMTWSTATTAVSGGIVYGSTTGLNAGTSYGMGVWVRCSVAQTLFLGIDWNTAGGAYISSSPAAAVTLVANVWTRLTNVAVAPATATQGNLTILATTGGMNWAVGNTLDIDDILIEAATTVGTDFNGNMPPDANNRYFWDSAPNASTSESEYRGVWVEQRTGGAPSVQVTVAGLGSVAGAVQVTRTADNETWTVPGWFNRSVIDTDTDPDFAPPLGRTVTYTCYLNGQQINQMSITVTSQTGWVQDPYDPTSAMPINTVLSDPSMLTLAHGALDSRTHVTNATKAAVMGAKRQYSITGQRLPDGQVILILNAWQNTTSDAFKAMAAAPILLFRGLPSWGSLPGLAYMDGPVQEFAINRYRVPGNNALTQWTITGDLIQPVSRKPITGQVTNAQVQTNLAGVTNATIAGRSGAKRNIDIKANPLGL